MAKPKVFKPTLRVPQGINNYTGDMFRCFTKGDTIPFKVTLNSDIVDVTGYKVIVIMSNVLMDGPCDGDDRFIEVEIPLVDAENGVFQGNVSGLHTQSLASGINYAMAKLVTAPATEDDLGDPYIIDMCMLEIYPTVTLIQDRR